MNVKENKKIITESLYDLVVGFKLDGITNDLMGELYIDTFDKYLGLGKPNELTLTLPKGIALSHDEMMQFIDLLHVDYGVLNIDIKVYASRIQILKDSLFSLKYRIPFSWLRSIFNGNIEATYYNNRALLYSNAQKNDSFSIEDKKYYLLLSLLTTLRIYYRLGHISSKWLSDESRMIRDSIRFAYRMLVKIIGAERG